MKKTFALLVFFAFMFSSFALAEFKFDLSPFENNPAFVVEIDDSTGKGEIFCDDSVTLLGDSGAGNDVLFGVPDVRIPGQLPPIICISFIYCGDDWVFTDKISLKPADTRYTFDVERSTDVVDDAILEYFTIGLTDESVKLVEDIIDGGITTIHFQLDGDRDVEGDLTLSNLEGLTELYNCYKLSGALDNDFSLLHLYFTCTID